MHLSKERRRADLHPRQDSGASARVSVELAARGSVRLTSLAGIPLYEFMAFAAARLNAAG